MQVGDKVTVKGDVASYGDGRKFKGIAVIQRRATVTTKHDSYCLRDEKGRRIWNGGFLAFPERLLAHVAENTPANDIQDIERYLNDLDNLLDTGHFPESSIAGFTFFHNELTLRDFVDKGRELIRKSLMNKKGLPE